MKLQCNNKYRRGIKTNTMITKDQLSQAWETIRQWDKENTQGIHWKYYNELLIQLDTTNADVTGKSRQRAIVYKRIILANKIRQKFDTISDEKIAQILNKDRTTIVYYTRQYQLLKLYKDFRLIEKKVVDLP